MIYSIVVYVSAVDDSSTRSCKNVSSQSVELNFPIKLVEDTLMTIMIGRKFTRDETVVLNNKMMMATAMHGIYWLVLTFSESYAIYHLPLMCMMKSASCNLQIS